MKVKVLKRFKDKHTNEIHKVNAVIDVTEERYKEILTKGKLVEEIAEDQTQTPEDQTQTPEDGKNKQKSTKKTTK